MLNSISTAFKSLLRPSEMTAHDKSPADSLSSVIAEGQSDVDKVLIHLEAKEFTVEPSTLQSLQQLIQWVADLALNLLVRIPDSRPCASKPYEPLRDPKALNMLREMIVLIRIWGILLPPCLPVFTKSDASLDVLALVFRLLSRLVQTVNEPDDALIGKHYFYYIIFIHTYPIQCPITKTGTMELVGSVRLLNVVLYVHLFIYIY